MRSNNKFTCPGPILYSMLIHNQTRTLKNLIENNAANKVKYGNSINYRRIVNIIVSCPEVFSSKPKTRNVVINKFMSSPKRIDIYYDILMEFFDSLKTRNDYRVN
jgi:hypothetical protein